MSIVIIGEIGINHNGDLKLAKQLIDMAGNILNPPPPEEEQAPMPQQPGGV